MTKRKVNIKETIKIEVIKEITSMLEANGIKVLSGKDFGMTTTTIVARLTETDIQIKLITPKAGVIRYEELE